MTNDHLVLLANRLRNCASALRSRRDFAGHPDLQTIADTCTDVADELEGPPWHEAVNLGLAAIIDDDDGRGSIELTDRGRAYEP